MDIAKPLLEPQHFLADNGKTEMAGLDDAGVDRADRDFVYPVAFDADEGIVFVAWREARIRRVAA